MNRDKNIIAHMESLKDIKLSDSSRARILENLKSHAAFYEVRERSAHRSIDVVSPNTSLFSFKFAYMPLLILLTVMIGGGASLAAEASLPGDVLYPVKINLNENVRGAFTFGADSEARLQTALLDERIEEAEKLRSEGRLTGDTAMTVAAGINEQAEIATVAAEKSSPEVAMETNARVQVALQTFLASVTPDTSIATAADVNTNADTATMGIAMAKGLYDIEAYKADMSVRTAALVKVITKNSAKLGAEVKADLSAKMATATKLTAEAQTQAEAAARASLDQAAVLAGEVEATLSTLGQVVIDTNTGIITDIDFSVDPMLMKIGDEAPTATGTGSGSVEGNGSIQLNGALDTEVINAAVGGEGSVEQNSTLGI